MNFVTDANRVILILNVLCNVQHKSCCLHFEKKIKNYNKICVTALNILLERVFVFVGVF